MELVIFAFHLCLYFNICFFTHVFSVLWIHEILVRIRIHTSVRMRIRILLFSLVIFKMSTKNYFFLFFFCLLRFEGKLHHFLKIKSRKEFTKQFLGINVFLTIFA
jgi:hypothetical protein